MECHKASFLGHSFFNIHKPSFSCFQIFFINHVDDTDLFYPRKIYPHCFFDKILFKNANDELGKISKWFKATKFSLIEGKANFTLFHKWHDDDSLPLQLPNLKINNYKIKRSSSIKFLDVLVDENLTWVDHIRAVENKLFKNVRLLHKAKNCLIRNLW